MAEYNKLISLLLVSSLDSIGQLRHHIRFDLLQTWTQVHTLFAPGKFHLNIRMPVLLWTQAIMIPSVCLSKKKLTKSIKFSWLNSLLFVALKILQVCKGMQYERTTELHVTQAIWNMQLKSLKNTPICSRLETENRFIMPFWKKEGTWVSGRGFSLLGFYWSFRGMRAVW